MGLVSLYQRNITAAFRRETVAENENLVRQDRCFTGLGNKSHAELDVRIVVPNLYPRQSIGAFRKTPRRNSIFV